MWQTEFTTANLNIKTDLRHISVKENEGAMRLLATFYISGLNAAQISGRSWALIIQQPHRKIVLNFPQPTPQVGTGAK